MEKVNDGPQAMINIFAIRKCTNAFPIPDFPNLFRGSYAQQSIYVNEQPKR